MRIRIHPGSLPAAGGAQLITPRESRDQDLGARAGGSAYWWAEARQRPGGRRGRAAASARGCGEHGGRGGSGGAAPLAQDGQCCRLRTRLPGSLVLIAAGPQASRDAGPTLRAFHRPPGLQGPAQPRLAPLSPRAAAPATPAQPPHSGRLGLTRASAASRFRLAGAAGSWRRWVRAPPPPSISWGARQAPESAAYGGPRRSRRPGETARTAILGCASHPPPASGLP